MKFGHVASRDTNDVVAVNGAFGAVFDLDADDSEPWDFLLKAISRCLEEVRDAEKMPIGRELFP